MSEHEQFIKICDKIGYEIDLNLYKIGRTYIRERIKKQCTQCLVTTGTDRIINVREIIFTPEFMKKLENYCYDNIDKDLNLLRIMIMSNLKAPVQYLYETLGL